MAKWPLFCVISLNSAASGAHCVKVVEDIPILSVTEMYPKASSFYQYITYDDTIYMISTFDSLEP